MTKIFYLMMFVLVAACATGEVHEKKSSFVSYNSSKDDYPSYEQTSRVPASKEECRKTTFLSYRSDKDFPECR